MKEDIQFLKDLQKQMQYENEHDYDCQASPRFWTIMNYRIVPANEEYDNGFEQHFHNDGDHTEFKNFTDLKEFIEEYFEEEIEQDKELQELLNDENESFYELWEYVEDNLNEDGFFSKVFVKEEEYVVPNTMFLTKEEAKEHLKLNYYHYTSKAHTYAMTAWRAPKVERLFKILSEFDFGKYHELLKKVEQFENQQKELTRVIARNLIAWDTSKDKREGLLPEVYLANRQLYKELTGEEYFQHKAIKKFNIE